jgi:hypothetical protein
MLGIQELTSLKCEILEFGIHIDPSAMIALRRDNIAIAPTDYATTQGVPLQLGDEVYVNAPFREHFVSQGKFSLTFQDNKFLLSTEGQSLSVNPFLLPAYHDMFLHSGARVRSVINTHTDRGRINPILGCAWKCDFCDAPFREKYRFNTLVDILESLDIAIEDKIKPAKHILVSGGTPRPKDLEQLDLVYREVARVSRVPVDVMMSPRLNLDHPKKLVDWGINDLFVNLELVDQTKYGGYMVQKAKLGVEYYLNYLEIARKAFGKGRVMSLIVIGIEEREAVIKGVKMLCEIGIIPVLSPFRPALGTPLVDASRPNAAFLMDTLLECVEIADRYGISLGPKCLACNHNCLNLPVNNSFYKTY